AGRGNAPEVPLDGGGTKCQKYPLRVAAGFLPKAQKNAAGTAVQAYDEAIRHSPMIEKNPTPLAVFSKWSGTRCFL
ncbi:MAG: hypothetical protein LUC47_11175, partial [Clostridiales bacterium]|nr:hypothetical protein [Clostridiales bacterium]